MPQLRSLFKTSCIVSGLVTEDQLKEVLELICRKTGSPPIRLDDVRDDEAAEELIKRGLVSRYQAEQLMNGRTRFNLGVYIITDFIGQGGMGQVYKAKHNLMGREVAVKVLPKPRSTPEAEANFHREIRLQAKLDHPNLVRAYDAGHDGNVYYLVVEYVPGTDLRRLVRTQGRLDMQQSATVIMQAAKGLHHAHLQGLIHRDVKPGNLLVTPEGHTKVSDLGLAGFVNEGSADPRAGKIVGTADYISPEVFKSPNDVSPLSDIYSLGCSLYYAVTGKVPYPGGTTREKLERHCHSTPYHPRRFAEDISEEFVEVIADMMEKDPSQRIQSAAEVAARLEAWAKGEGPLPRMSRMRWTPPPLPDIDGDQDTADLDPQEAEPSGHGSQGTVPVVIAGEETYPMTPSSQPPPPSPEETAEAPPQANSQTAAALAIAIPIAMFAGALLMFLVMKLL